MDGLLVGFALGVAASLTAAVIVASVTGQGWIVRLMCAAKRARMTARERRARQFEQEQRLARQRVTTPLINQVVMLAGARQLRLPIRCVGSDWGGDVYVDTLGDNGYWGLSKHRPIVGWTEAELRAWIDTCGLIPGDA
jgi:hypothetical protein